LGAVGLQALVEIVGSFYLRLNRPPAFPPAHSLARMRACTHARTHAFPDTHMHTATQERLEEELKTARRNADRYKMLLEDTNKVCV